MPIFVQWKWNENTKSFLVIFHFYDDYSKPNLRLKRLEKVEPMQIETIEDALKLIRESVEESILKKYGNKWYHVCRIRSPEHREFKSAYMTWAPSHVELALLSELLSYANLVNGFIENKKRSLKHKLEITEDEINPELIESIQMGMGILRLEKNLCFEISTGYIDYLRKLLKPYL